MKKKRQLYRNAWEYCEEFKNWLTSVPNEPTKCYCKFCKKILISHKLSLLKHCSSIKHMNNESKESAMLTKNLNKNIDEKNVNFNTTTTKLTTTTAAASQCLIIEEDCVDTVSYSEFDMIENIQINNRSGNKSADTIIPEADLREDEDLQDDITVCKQLLKIE